MSYHALRGLTQLMTGFPWKLDLEEELFEIIDGVRDGKADAAAFAARVAKSDFLPGSAGYHHLFARNV